MKNATQGATWGGRRARAIGALMSLSLVFGGSIATAGTASAKPPAASTTVTVDTTAPSGSTTSVKSDGVVTTLRFGSTWS